MTFPSSRSPAQEQTRNNIGNDGLVTSFSFDAVSRRISGFPSAFVCGEPMRVGRREECFEVRDRPGGILNAAAGVAVHRN